MARCVVQELSCSGEGYGMGYVLEMLHIQMSGLGNLRHVGQVYDRCSMLRCAQVPPSGV